MEDVNDAEQDTIEARENDKQKDDVQRLKDQHLSDLDLEKIDHYLRHGKEHDICVSDQTILRHFQLIDNKLFRIHKTQLIPVKGRQQAVKIIRDFHESQGHPTVGTLARALKDTLWHPQFHLITQEVVIACLECVTRVPANRFRQQFT